MGRWTAGDEFSLCGRNIDGIWREAAEGSTLGGAQRAPPVCFANTLVRLFAPQGQTLLTPRFRSAQPWPLFATPQPLPTMQKIKGMQNETGS